MFMGGGGGGGEGTLVAHSLIFKYAQMFICNTYAYVTLLLLDFEKNIQAICNIQHCFSNYKENVDRKKFPKKCCFTSLMVRCFRAYCRASISKT
jgi:hypothetical protein